MSETAAQEEFRQLVDKNSEPSAEDRNQHPEDRFDRARESADAADFLDEDEQFRASEIDAAMRMPSNNGFNVQLPPASFDSGRATGVKGVIADARSYETARKQSWKGKVRNARHSVFSTDMLMRGSRDSNNLNEKSDSEDERSQDEDEESFLAQWRESRRRELESETVLGPAVRTRRTSPSVRMYGRFDEVDALGYLDAIEKVGRDTVVAVFVYDDECEVSTAVEKALRPLVSLYPAVHFVKVRYDEIEFDNAAVPSILAYREQGDLFANLTGLIELLPSEDDDSFSPEALRKLLLSHNVL